jgi:hypothetical protein
MNYSVFEVAGSSEILGRMSLKNCKRAQCKLIEGQSIGKNTDEPCNYLFVTSIQELLNSIDFSFIDNDQKPFVFSHLFVCPKEEWPRSLCTPNKHLFLPV